MKVLYIMNHADTGGAALAFKELVLTMKQHYDVEPIVLTGKKNSLNKIFDDNNIENYSFPFKNFISSYHRPEFFYRNLLYARHYFGNIFALKEIERCIDMNQIDLIHTNLDRIDIGAILASKFNKPHVWHLREHLGSDFNITSIYSNYINYMNKFNSNYVAVSESVKKTWILRGIKQNKITTIYDGINFDEIKKKNTFKSKKLNLLFLGGYSKHKGQMDFLKLLSKVSPDILKKITITFFGNGSSKYKKRLIQYTENLNMESFVKFNDYDSKIYNRICDYDVGINFSDNEGFGRITVEYMAAGLPVICTETGANNELIKNEENGFLVKKNDVEVLEHVLMILMKVHIREKMKIKNIKKAKYFSNSINSNKIYQLYNKTLKS